MADTSSAGISGHAAQEVLDNKPELTVVKLQTTRTSSYLPTLQTMATSTGLSTINRLITTHNAEGKAVFDDTFAPETPLNAAGGSNVLFGLHYTTEQFPVQMNGDQDIQAYQKYIQSPPGLTVSGGTVLRTVGK